MNMEIYAFVEAEPILELTEREREWGELSHKRGESDGVSSFRCNFRWKNFKKGATVS